MKETSSSCEPPIAAARAERSRPTELMSAPALSSALTTSRCRASTAMMSRSLKRALRSAAGAAVTARSTVATSPAAIAARSEKHALPTHGNSGPQ